ncbi:MAG TPA: TetR/AcrR family transcriptional regulator [Solirubrobacteraceae bacterium]|nr:TetR/AcrR family transcriptional regulator [Solirubrobacteraceae bacterium]
MDVDLRRAQLLEVGARLFTEHGYDGVSMSRVASAAGISKGLLYHYFPGKREFFVATLEAAADELRNLTVADPALPPLEQLSHAVDAYLEWIDAHADSYARLLQSAGALADAASLVERMRTETAERIVSGLTGAGDPSPKLRAAVHGWLWFMDGACTQWLANDRQPPRAELRDLLVDVLAAAAGRAGASPA